MEPASAPESEIDAAQQSALPSRVLAEPGHARWFHWGRRDYGEVLALQERLREARRAETVPDLWLVGEHDPVITLGARGDEVKDLVGHSGGVPVYRVDRGGQATIHNPGQLVIYPIVRTQEGLLSQARLSRALLETMRDWLGALYGVTLDIPRGRPGLFFGERKVAAIGVSIRRRVSMHGIAINLCNDLSAWKLIVACGEPQTRPITMSEILGREVKPAEMLNGFENWLQKALGYENIKRAETLDTLI